MRRTLLAAGSCWVLAACGAHGAAAPSATQGHRTPDAASPSTSTSPAFSPRHASVRTASWRLPAASARQAVVPLGSGRLLLAGGLLPGDVSTDRVTRIDLRSGRAGAMPPLAVPVHDVAGGLAGTTPVVVGGGNATEQDGVQMLRAGRWRVVAQLPTTRSDLSTVAVGARLLVIGGYDGVGTPAGLLRIGADGRPQPFGRLARGVRYAATAVAGHTAYVFGGEVQGQELSSVQAVDLRTGRTKVVASLPVALGHAMAATVGDRILLMGGRVTPDRQTSRMWWFAPATARFSPAGSLPVPLSDAAVGTSGHRVWLLGGEDPSETDRVLLVNVR